MKSHLTLLILPLALAAAATQARGQTPVVWSMNASSCVPRSSGASLVENADPIHGIVNFNTGKYGDIRLSCPVPFLTNSAYEPIYGLSLALTFYNDHGFDGGVNHCFLEADLLRSNLNPVEAGWDIKTVAAINQSYSGKKVVWLPLPEALDFRTSYYWVDVWLHRDAPNATCNPIFVGVDLEPSIQ